MPALYPLPNDRYLRSFVGGAAAAAVEGARNGRVVVGTAALACGQTGQIPGRPFGAVDEAG